MITILDEKQIAEKAIPLHIIDKQIDNFINGFPFIQLVRPASKGDGILSFEKEAQSFYQSYFRSVIPNLKVVKFVPASGAASRMFKHLFEYKEMLLQSKSKISEPLIDPGFATAPYFLTKLSKIAFYKTLCALLKRNELDLEKIFTDQTVSELLDFILNENGLNYANLPKALILFHDYPGGARTAAEEHLVEAANYTKDKYGKARIHFTISPEHLEKFTDLFSKVKTKYEKEFKVNFDISYSVQKPSTDVLAVDENNEPFRNQDGSLLFRPGGHGALIQNLNEIDADLVFIKNIDNIVPDHLKDQTYRYKELIGGYLLWIKDKIFTFLREAENGSIPRNDLMEMLLFAKERLMLSFPEKFNLYSENEKLTFLVSRISRPIRVCGMVRNEGEPGGGPFWVAGRENEQSLQIVESSQVNLLDEDQNKIWRSATYFNPVDLVCSYSDHHGRKYDLSRFVDEKTGFISIKSSGGKNLKAQELPGLWNGSMAGWLTLFIEVPIITFNPVKTVNDLLRKEHLAG